MGAKGKRMLITHCRTNHMENPLGYELGKPLLSWCLEETQRINTQAFMIKVSEDPDMKHLFLRTGRRKQFAGNCYRIEKELKPRCRYYWSVTVWMEDGSEIQSSINWFETGKLEEPWMAQWITCENKEKRHPVFRQEMYVRRPVASARIYICGLGLYELYLNGRRIGQEYLAPGCNNYASWLQYQTYDITGELKQENQFAVLLGNGWYKGRFGLPGTDSSACEKSYSLIAEIHVRFTDGSELILGTGEKWEVVRSCITESGIYDGERADATLPEMTPVKAQLSGIPEGKLSARYSLPVKVCEEFPAEIVSEDAEGRILDIGQNIAGTFRLRVHEKAGRTIRLKFCEQLQDGKFSRDNLRSARADYEFVSDGKVHLLQPSFTFYGYRYVLIQGISRFKVKDFCGLALTSMLEETGHLTTGNELVNRLISNIEWSRRDNFIDVPTDCPQRDERLGWTGDAQVFAGTACYLTDCYAFYRKYLHDMATEQKCSGGMVPNTVPRFGMKGVSSGWGDAAAIIPWKLYQFSADRTILEEQYESMKSWVDYITEEDGTDYGWRKKFHFGDWLALDVPNPAPGQTRGATDEGFIADVFYMYSTEILTKTAAVLGKKQDQEKYAWLAAGLRIRIRKEYYTPTGRCAIGTQTGLLLTLFHHLADPEKNAAALRKSFENTHGKLETGFIGTSILCPVLSENGMQDIAEALLMNEDYPGWLHEVKMGATTVWERWNSLDENGHFSSTGMNSLNHYAYGAVLEWMYSCLAGLRPESAGFGRAEIRPEFLWELHHLSCAYQSTAGKWKIDWNIISPSETELDITVPYGCTAHLILPQEAEVRHPSLTEWKVKEKEAGYELTAGKYHILCGLAHPLHVIHTTKEPAADLLKIPSVRAVLLNAMPQLSQLPDRMQQIPLRQMAVRMGGEAMTAKMDSLDQLLEKI